ncbi:MAG: hypothetical protein HYR94_21865 [Chloroflexi bacterium]|nr:hypothetical protein [Chloroflexota bacterium]
MLKAIILYLFTTSLAIPLILNLLPHPTGISGILSHPPRSESNLIQATALYTLYDGSQGNLPGDQSFIYLTQPFPPSSASQIITTDGTILNTLPVTDDFAGYVNRPEQTPVLDRAGGYTVNFTVQVMAEAHDGSDKNGDGIDDRAGFSVTVLSSDSEGIELGFWTDQIWAQDDDTNNPSDLLTHAEGVTFTTTSLIPYSLAILSNTYTLSAAGSSILSGSLRNYSAFTPPLPGLPNPYTSTNFISLGDNSSSARGQIKLTAVSVSPVSTSTVTNVPTYLPLILRHN